ncbi:putative acyl-CoA dehydrogenase IBR3 [Ceratocystis fimbriata CBS 114723]|uniref:Putative acyl-CoA dehydrogenase IBR3 n=1 Tax=Ceratocystis fimbriata CBS 114723 TaxID=1035309 RepID=A0A2C5XD59_9PEZI|nr:putative acyl-CoA dehydrogenase IBR3 [Ceratocystis fimbriata CBS 114723]
MAGTVRQPIDEAALARYLSTAAPTISQPFTVKQFGFGQSNPTYQLTSLPTAPGGKPQHHVLRKKPPGALVSKTAHKVEREYRVLSALSNASRSESSRESSAPGVPVPKTVCLCEDSSVIGTPFYVMEFVEGRIFEDFLMPDVVAADRAAMWRQAVTVLSALHAVDYKGIGLETFGRPNGFFPRQVATWKAICEAQQKVRDVETGEPVGRLPYMDELLQYFGDPKNQPRDRAGLVHGDFKIDNMMFAREGTEVVGLLDWEMSTIGHPLSDLCNFLTKFILARQSEVAAASGITITKVAGPAGNPLAVSDPAFLPGRTPGLPSLDEIVSWYAASSGYDPRIGNELVYGMAFTIFRLAAICHGIAARYALRQANSAMARQNGLQMVPLAEYAWALVLATKKLTLKL